MLHRAVLSFGCGRGRPSARRLFSSSGGGAGGSGGGEELGALPLAFPTVCIWGSNTGVGKTLFSAGIAAACRRAGLPTLYLKPVQTGFPGDSDARLVAAAAGLPLVAGPHAAELDRQGLAGGGVDGSSGGGGGSGRGDLATTLYAWQQAVSPHLAVQREGRPVSDRQVAAAVAAELRAFAAAGSGGRSREQRIAIVETAGGVASPGPSGSLQCDLLRPLRLPGILVGDGRLGGISATLSAYDSLALRGHQVPLVVLMDDGQLANSEAIRKQLRGTASVLAFPVCQPPPPPARGDAPQQQLEQIDASLAEWLAASAPQFDALLWLASQAHRDRLDKLGAAAGDARRTLWWPFTQHASVASDGAVTVIDGRVGESFCVYKPAAAAAAVAGGTEGAAAEAAAAAAAAAGSDGDRLELMFDACASWWTQGVSQQAQPELVRAVSAAAARYGHVMFPEIAHEPAIELAKQVLGTVGAGWAARVFYSDNGSTAIEVALKMAFRKYMVDHQLLEAEEEEEGGSSSDGSSSNSSSSRGGGGAGRGAGGLPELAVVGLQEGYHGDTLGAMDAVAPSPFNGRLQTPWYTGRGLFLDPPTVALQQGAWRVRLPSDMRAAAGLAPAAAAEVQFASQAEVFALAQRMAAAPSGQQQQQQQQQQPSLYSLYRSHIQQQLDQYNQQQQGQRRLGALILEPVLQGAGGMRLIDPLYQRALVEVCREAGLPVIFDEVFTGFWRLGATSGGALLGVHPDVACCAKLMTGGLLPLAATLAREEVFDAFQGDSKMSALLHGHSYTAHAVGCAVGVAALRLYRDPGINPNWCTPEAPGRCQRQQGGGGGSSCGSCGCSASCGRLVPLWDEVGLAALSQHPRVQGVVPLGTVLAVQLRSEGGAGGYASNAAATVVRRLRQVGVFGRPLGDVVYLMVTPMTERQQCADLLGKLAAALDAPAA